MTEDDVQVLSANESFYQAFATRDFGRMDDLWARRRAVTCIHPGWDLLLGREQVMASWRAILRSEEMRIEASAARVLIAGEVAYVVCHEGARGEPAMLIATNIFAREEGSWKMIHHQAGQLARPPEPAKAKQTPTN